MRPKSGGGNPGTIRVDVPSPRPTRVGGSAACPALPEFLRPVLPPKKLKTSRINYWLLTFGNELRHFDETGPVTTDKTRAKLLPRNFFK